jgi:K+-transporting ATPase KdpF subunit
VLRHRRADREGGGSAVTLAMNLIGLVVAIALLVYLVVSLVFPERF